MKVSTALRAIPVLAVALAALTACGPETGKAAGSSSDSSSGAAQGSSSSAGVASPTSRGDRSGEDSPSDGAVTTDRSGAQDADSEAVRDGGPQRCTSEHLRVSVENQDSGVGSTHFQLVFRNTGTAPCTLAGFPGVSFRGRDGAQIGAAADRAPGMRATSVTLIPRAHAAVDAQALNGQAGLSDAQCQLTSVSFLAVFPPESREQIDVPWKTSECGVRGAHGLQTGPVHPVR
ncbi:DUF4232 domain-containing protein [Streptomyces sp. NPDC088733]|uniref:DUF4232 domain-containing protein n=1 Tax=Streptomyces sp. NPDC088733 TaxID=3365880 RepID=UPI00382471E2